MPITVLKKFHLPLVATILVACSLVFAGMRVPDLSRPHRPKPVQKAVLENPQKPSAASIRQTPDQVAVVAAPFEVASPLLQRTVPSRTARTLLTRFDLPKKSRSPPLSVRLA